MRASRSSEPSPFHREIFFFFHANVLVLYPAICRAVGEGDAERDAVTIHPAVVVSRSLEIPFLRSEVLSLSAGVRLTFFYRGAWCTDD